MNACVLMLPESLSISFLVGGVTDDIKYIGNFGSFVWVLPPFYKAIVDCEGDALEGGN